MATANYEEVLKLARQLRDDEKQLLAETLQDDSAQSELSFEEWDRLFESLIIQRPILWDFSPRREDWYNDDGR